MCAGQRFAGGEMEVSEDALASAHVRPFRRYRFFHLDDQPGCRPHRSRIGCDPGTRIQILRIAEPAAQPCARLDQHGLPIRDQRLDTGRRQRDAILVSFNLLRDAYFHVGLSKYSCSLLYNPRRSWPCPRLFFIRGHGQLLQFSRLSQSHIAFQNG